MNAACIIGLHHLKHCYQVKQPMALHQRLTIRVCLFGGEKGEEGRGGQEKIHPLPLFGWTERGRGGFWWAKDFPPGTTFPFHPKSERKVERKRNWPIFLNRYVLLAHASLVVGGGPHSTSSPPHPCSFLFFSLPLFFPPLFLPPDQTNSLKIERHVRPKTYYFLHSNPQALLFSLQKKFLKSR
jgi:hypothetical protein